MTLQLEHFTNTAAAAVTPVGALRVLQDREKKIMEHNEATSPLLRLPGEVRNKIFNHIFDQQAFVTSSTRDSWSFKKARARYGVDNSWGRPCPVVYFGILLTCRQLYAEAWSLPFQLMDLECRTGKLNEFATAKLKPHQRDAVLSIKLRFHHGQNGWVFDDSQPWDVLTSLNTNISRTFPNVTCVKACWWAAWDDETGDFIPLEEELTKSHVINLRDFLQSVNGRGVRIEISPERPWPESAL